MNSIKKNFIYNSAYQVLAMIIPLITTPYMSRVLGASGIGSYSYAFSVASYFVMFIMLGLNNYGNREIAKCRDNPKKLSQYFWSIYSMQLFMGIIVNVVYIIYISQVNNKLLPFIFGIYVISGCYDVNWFCFGLEQFKFIATRNAVVKIFSTVLIFVLVKSADDVAEYCIIIASSLAISALVIWPYVLKKVGFYRPKLREIAVHIKPNLFLFMTVIAVSLFKIMDKIMLGMITTEEQVGFYEVSEKIIAIPTALITSLGTVMLPRMSNLVEKREKESNHLLYVSMLFAMFMVSSLCFGIMGVSRTFVPLFYGKGYDICIPIYLILLPSCLFLGMANVVRTQYLLPHSMDKAYVASAFIGACINIIINLLLIPNYGAIGAAVGTLVAEATVCIYQCYECRKGISFVFTLKRCVLFVFNGIVMFCVLFFSGLAKSGSVISLFLQVGIGAFIYLFLTIVEILLYKKVTQKPLFGIMINGIII